MDKCYICIEEIETLVDNLRICKTNGCKYYVHKECFLNKKEYEERQNIILYDCDICRSYIKDELKLRYNDFIRENILNAVNNPVMIGIFCIVYSIYVYILVLLINKK